MYGDRILVNAPNPSPSADMSVVEHNTTEYDIILYNTNALGLYRSPSTISHGLILFYYYYDPL